MFPINQKSINKLTALGMMTALVFVSNYLRITIGTDAEMQRFFAASDELLGA